MASAHQAMHSARTSADLASPGLSPYCFVRQTSSPTSNLRFSSGSQWPSRIQHAAYASTSVSLIRAVGHATGRRLGCVTAGEVAAPLRRQPRCPQAQRSSCCAASPDGHRVPGGNSDRTRVSDTGCTSRHLGSKRSIPSASTAAVVPSRRERPSVQPRRLPWHAPPARSIPHGPPPQLRASNTPDAPTWRRGTPRRQTYAEPMRRAEPAAHKTTGGGTG